jgi:hypothetical protein
MLSAKQDTQSLIQICFHLCFEITGFPLTMRPFSTTWLSFKLSLLKIDTEIGLAASISKVVFLLSISAVFSLF